MTRHFLAITYTEAWQITKNPFYEKKAREILEYLIRDMTSSEGGVYSAEKTRTARERKESSMSGPWGR